MSTPPSNELDFLIREEMPDGTIKVRPRFDFPLNYLFSDMSKEQKKAFLKMLQRS